MKNSIKYLPLLAVLFAVTAQAQSLDKDAVAFVKTYQDAYNKGDRATLMTMYSDSVGWVNRRDGSIKKYPKSDWDEDYVRDFNETVGTHQDFTVNSTKALPGGKMAIATTFTGYNFDRKTNAKVDPASGSWDVVIGKEGGNWKIGQMKSVSDLSILGDEMLDLIKKFQDASNREDLAMLKTTMTDNTVYIEPDGTTQKGIAQVSEEFAKGFASGDANTYINLANIVPQFDGSAITTGAYYQNGRTTTGARGNFDGAYTIKTVKENGQWKIAETKVSPLVKTLTYHKVADYDAWKKVFDRYANERRFAGVLNTEVGTLLDDPGTVYIITEWASQEASKAFTASPAMVAAMKQSGATGNRTVLYLDKK